MDPSVPAAATTLVIEGANALSRNPRYVGMAGGLVAHAIVRRSWAALLPAGALVALLTVGQIAAEEKVLVRQFGERYEQYRTEVPRWVDLRTVRALARRLRLDEGSVNPRGVAGDGAADPRPGCGSVQHAR